MLIAVNAHGEYISAQHAEAGPFRCPVCFSPVVLKKGRHKIAHFSHQRVMDCHKTLYKKESLGHLAGKHHLYDLFAGDKAMMEYYIADIEQIPDVLVNHQYAFELQLSPISSDLVQNRTFGYKSIGIKVYWIAGDESLDTTRGLKVNVFQRSLIDDYRLLSYNVSENALYEYQLTGINAQLNFTYHKVRLSKFNFNYQPNFSFEPLQLTERDKKHYISRCLAQKSVLEPTLSALYQMNIDFRALPATLGLILPAQYYIKNHPIEWQSRLMLMLKNNDFELHQFTSILKFHSYSVPVPSKHEIARVLVTSYYDAVKKLCVHL